jgi:hypothetical protein
MKLAPDTIFVFGSNEAGRHGEGGTLYALKHYGVVYGQGVGMQGQSYAIPTKDIKLKTLTLWKIDEYVEKFLDYAYLYDDLKFHLTPIGCGLAGYKPADIAPMFRNAPSNVILPHEFIEILKPA